MLKRLLQTWKSTSIETKEIVIVAIVVAPETIAMLWLMAETIRCCIL